MAYPRTDAQRPTYWKVINYYSKRFHESRVIAFSVGKPSKNEKIRVRQNRGSSFYFFKKETLYILKIETYFRTYQSSVVRPPAVFFPQKKHPLEEKCLYPIFLIQIPTFLGSTPRWRRRRRRRRRKKFSTTTTGPSAIMHGDPISRSASPSLR